jgi:hypothetical protein
LADQNRIAHTKIRAERRAGELLTKLDRSPGGRPSEKTPARVAAVSPYRAALEANGISERSAERWQTVARWISESAIRAEYDRCIAEAEEFTSGTIYEAASWARFEAAHSGECVYDYLWRAAHSRPRSKRRKRYLADSLPQYSPHVLQLRFESVAERTAVAQRLDLVALRSGTGRCRALALLLDLWESTHQAPPAGAREAT